MATSSATAPSAPIPKAQRSLRLDFEDASSDWTLDASPSVSQANARCNTLAPLSGSSDLLLTGVLPVGAAQEAWARLRLTFPGGTGIDAREALGIRLKIRSNAPRDVALILESDRDRDPSARLSQVIPLRASPTSLTFYFSQFRYPAALLAPGGICASLQAKATYCSATPESIAGDLKAVQLVVGPRSDSQAGADTLHLQLDDLEFLYSEDIIP